MIKYECLKFACDVLTLYSLCYELINQIICLSLYLGLYIYKYLTKLQKISLCI